MQLKHIEAKAKRIVELVRIREEALMELNDMLEPTTAELKVLEKDENPILAETEHRAEALSQHIDQKNAAIQCKKCARIRAGGDGRGRHNKGCPRSNGPVIERTIEPPKEVPLEGITADYRSRCCQERVIQKGNKLECFKCGNETEPYQPKPPEKKEFDCDACGASFEADTSDVVRCTQCGGSDVWPKKV